MICTKTTPKSELTCPGHMRIGTCNGYIMIAHDCPIDDMSLEVVCFHWILWEKIMIVHRASDATGNLSLRLLDHFPVQIDVCLEMRLVVQEFHTVDGRHPAPPEIGKSL